MELRKIRSLAQEIIDQRSDLEQYFHDSLEHVFIFLCLIPIFVV